MVSAIRTRSPGTCPCAPLRSQVVLIELHKHHPSRVGQALLALIEHGHLSTTTVPSPRQPTPLSLFRGLVLRPFFRKNFMKLKSLSITRRAADLLRYVASGNSQRADDFTGRAADLLHYLAARRQVVTSVEFARLLDLDNPADHPDVARQVTETLKILDDDDGCENRPSRGALVVHADGPMIGLPYVYSWDSRVATIAERHEHHQKILPYVFKYPYELRCSEEQRRRMDAVTKLDNGTIHRRGLLKLTDTLTPVQAEVLRVLASEAKTAPQWANGFHRHEATCALIHLVNLRICAGLPFAAFGDTIDDLVSLGHLTEANGILKLPASDSSTGQQLPRPARQHGGHEVVERHV